MPYQGSPTRYFCLSGVVIHELRWQDILDHLLTFRRWLKRMYGIYLDDELHAADMILNLKRLPTSLQKLKKHHRLSIIRHFADEISNLPDINIINVVVDKAKRVPNKYEAFRWAWYTLFQRFENTIRNQNFPGPKNTTDRGIVFTDETDGAKLTRYLNKMRISNKLKVRQEHGSVQYIDDPIRVIVEDPVLRNSRDSYLVQVADCSAFLLKQSIQPCSYMKKHGGQAYFKRLDRVLCKHACNRHSKGVVIL